MNIVGMAKDSVSFGSDWVAGLFRKDVAQKAIEDNGFYTVNQFLNESSCDRIKSAIDGFLDSDNNNSINVWSDSVGGDHRIYGFESLYDLNEAGIDVKRLAREGEKYLGKKLRYFTVLGARIDKVPGDIGSGGGWHRDSAHRHQFKAIIYISNASEKNGPFQYIRGTHTGLSKIKMGAFGDSQTRFSNSEIDGSIEDANIVTFCGNKGTCLMVDTRGIHRGMPLIEGSRYAITFYFYERALPIHLDKLTQSGMSSLF